MDIAVKMGKDSATGSFQLFIGKIASTLVLGIGSIIVGMFIDQGEYGLYTIAMVPAVTFMLFQDLGVNYALTKYCANYRAAKMEGELRKIIATGLAFDVTMGVALTSLSLLAANFVASTVFRSPESALLISLASITILFGAIYSGSVSVFVGFERMKLSTVAMIISATLQGLLSPLLVYLGFGALGAMVGFAVGSIGSGVTSVTLLYFAIFRKLPKESMNKTRLLQTLKPMLSYGIPISIAAIISGIAPQIYSFVMASSTDVTFIGNYRIALNFTVFLTFFIYPIQTVLFPAFSKLSPLKDKQLLKTVFASSVKYSSLFLVPAIIAIMVLSTSLIGTIYGDKWPFAPLFLTLCVIGDLPILLGGLTYGRLLYATGETKFIVKLNALSLIIGAPLALLIIPPFGILGKIIGGLVSVVPVAIIGLYWTWKHYETKADMRNSARILLASTIAGVATYLFQITFAAAAWIMLALGIALFLVVYVVSIPLIGAVNQVDISNLRVMFSALGPVSKLLQLPLALIEALLKIRRATIKKNAYAQER